MRPGPRSRAQYRKALGVLVGGVNSPVRTFKSVGRTPVFFEKAKGAHLYDVDGNRYLDFCMSWGALPLGHADPGTVEAVRAQARKGTSFGAPTPYETELALLIRRHMPSCQKLRFTSSGTEAVMTALRLARGVTGKSRIIKFEGCYHGHSDSLLVKAGSGLATLGQATSKGVPAALAAETLVLPYNDIGALEAAFSKFQDVAAVIIEAIAANMGVVPGRPEFLSALRRLTRKHKALLIFDEVITGFRVDLGGAQGLYGIEPDLTTLGKAIGGGMPVGAVGGPAALMDHLAPEGPVYQAGTLSGNPLSMAAGIRTLRTLSRPGFFKRLKLRSQGFIRELEPAFARNGVPAHVPSFGSLFGIFFQAAPPADFGGITSGHVAIYRRFFSHMLEKGVYLPPSAYEAFFTSAAHTDADLRRALAAVKSFRYNSRIQR